MKKVKISACAEIAHALVQNLGRNCSQVRIATLKVLEKAFEPEPFKEYDPEAHTNIDLESSKNYSGPCNVIALLQKFEKDEINIDSEKLKSNCLRSIQVLVHTGLMPDFYMDMTYTFLLGCLWIKFLPLQAPIIDCLKEVFVT